MLRDNKANAILAIVVIVFTFMVSITSGFDKFTFACIGGFIIVVLFADDLKYRSGK